MYAVLQSSSELCGDDTTSSHPVTLQQGATLSSKSTRISGNRQTTGAGDKGSLNQTAVPANNRTTVRSVVHGGVGRDEPEASSTESERGLRVKVSASSFRLNIQHSRKDGC